ncbi:MAG: hypothetical protein LQ338_002490 [Usnochroma carphineum]|nr:MAG: hypothetical protein LQ338_002490 [Usnochroma carphineum]
MHPNPATAKPAPLDLSHHYSHVTKNRGSSAVKDFYKYFRIPNIGNLAGGLPNHNNFPFDTLEGAAALPNRFKPTPNKPVDPPPEGSSHSGVNSGPATSRVVVPKTSDNADVLRKVDLKSALQYGTAQGYPPLYSFLRQFARENMHPNIPYAGGPEIILTCGSTDGFSKTVELLSNVWVEGKDPVEDQPGLLVEEFCYMNAVQTARPRGSSMVPVKVDDEGMKASGKGGLQDVLETWDDSKGKRPHLMYTVTIGQNPTSGTLSVERRKEIYALCSKFDIVIVEDDPYWYLQYPSANEAAIAAPSQLASERIPPGSRNFNTPKSSGYAFLDSLIPSYLSVDTDGRVVRLDTFSKTVAPGCRLGWITTQPALCERLLRITECSTQQPSGFVQSMIAEMIMGPHSGNGRGGGKDDLGWKTDGWVRWLEGLRGNYERRMQIMCKIFEEGKQLVKTGRRQSMSQEWSVVDTVPMFDFVWPLGGMFVWVKVNFETHPLWKKTSPEKLSRRLWIHLTTPEHLILVAPGSLFAPTEEIRQENLSIMCTTITIPTLTDGVLPRLFHDSQPPPLLRTENVRSQGDSSANQNDNAMSEDLDNEIGAINSIYGEHTVEKAFGKTTPNQYLLTIPQVAVTLRLLIPDQYPETCFEVTAVEGVGSRGQKGFGNHVLITAREVVQRVFIPGQVCLFDLLQELEQTLDHEPSTIQEEHAEDFGQSDNAPETKIPRDVYATDDDLVGPLWTLSSTITEKKSVFLARACPVKSTTEAQSAITHLLAIDKRASKATHNISAYRICILVDAKEMVYQDCDDDGEDAAGGRLLKLLQMMGVWNVLVVVSRWYGGVKLGPARFGIINAVAREAVVAGGFTKD